MGLYVSLILFPLDRLLTSSYFLAHREAVQRRETISMTTEFEKGGKEFSSMTCAFSYSIYTKFRQYIQRRWPILPMRLPSNIYTHIFFFSLAKGSIGYFFHENKNKQKLCVWFYRKRKKKAWARLLIAIFVLYEQKKNVGFAVAD